MPGACSTHSGSGSAHDALRGRAGLTQMSRDRNGPEGRALKLTLAATFLAIAGLAGARERRRDAPPGVLEIGLRGLAAYRIGRMIAFERIAEPVREPFTATVPDASGTDETVVARGRGVQWAIGELLSCPTCVATWASLALGIGAIVLPGPTRFVVRVLGVTGLAELSHLAAEHLEWTARAARRAAA
jgi:hypothetical protein